MTDLQITLSLVHVQYLVSSRYTAIIELDKIFAFKIAAQ